MGDVTKRLISRWNQVWKEQAAEDKRQRIKMIVESLMFFFTCKGDLFGGGEDARVTYAKMRDPDDEDHNDGWLKEANFTAVNLYKALSGEQGTSIFGMKDLDDIDVITDKDKVERLLAKKVGDG